MKTEKIYSLVSLESFKEIFSLDDRDDTLSKYCLVTATHTAEQYCMRRLVKKRHYERIENTEELGIPLREYPVKEVLAVYALTRTGGPDGELLENDFYSLSPVEEMDLPYYLSLSPSVKLQRYIDAFTVVYWAGYGIDKAPADLMNACLELAFWTFSRFRGRRIGMTGNVRGGGRDGEHFELSMPQNVRSLLEPYKRKVI